MEKVVINAATRTVTGKKVNVLRREGKLPGVIYGHKFESTAIVMDLKEASKVLQSITASSIVTLNLDGKEHAALVREKQRDYIRNTYKHVDFQAISLIEKLRASVGFEVIGVSPAVKNFNGLVLTGIDQLDVECLPQYLPEKIVIDLAKLENIGDGIFVRDLQLDSHITVHTHADELIVHVVTQKVQEEAPAVEGEETSNEPEVIEKGKKEDIVPE